MAIGTRILAAICAAALLCTPVLSKKKKPEEITQTLELPKDPPAAITADPHRLIFRVAPLSSKGLLSAQTRDAVRALLKLTNNNETVVRVRAFVAGSGDLRRVPQIVSEVFTEHKLALPTVSVVQTGALPLTGAQLLLESISVSKKSETAPEGMLFVAGQLAEGGPARDGAEAQASDDIGLLARQSIDRFDSAVAKGGGSSVMRVTCFVSSLADSGAVASMISAKYPQAAVSVVQPRRAAPGRSVECEGSAKLARAAGGVAYVKDQDRVIGAAVSMPLIVLTGTQVAYGYEDRNARVAFERMNKVLEPVKASWKSVVEVRFYPLAASIAKQITRIRVDFLDAPAMSMLAVEGLPSIDASFAMDAIAVPQ